MVLKLMTLLYQMTSRALGLCVATTLIPTMNFSFFATIPFQLSLIAVFELNSYRLRVGCLSFHLFTQISMGIRDGNTLLSERMTLPQWVQESLL